VRRTTSGGSVDQRQPGAAVGPGTEPELAGRRLYVSVTMKFVVAQVGAAGWLGVSVWLSLPWVRELAAATSMLRRSWSSAWSRTCRAGWSRSWRSACCWTASHPCAGPTRRSRSRCWSRPATRRPDRGDDLLHRPPGLPGAGRGPGGRQRLHRWDPARDRSLRRRHRPARPLHRRVASGQEPRPQHRLGGRRDRAGHHPGCRHAVAPLGHPSARRPPAECAARRAGCRRLGAGPQQP
jgi:hypothetical protein